MTAPDSILVIGAQGMLGRDLVNVFPEYNLTAWDIEDLDITDEKAVQVKLDQLMPDVVINAAAYTDVDACESNYQRCLEVNGTAVGYLSRACRKNKSVLVHISTDYIFDGQSNEGYREHDAPNPSNKYGHSKLRGEQELIKETNRYYLIRTSWLFGLHGKNFVETILRLAEQRDVIQVVDDQRGSPTYTLDLAEQIKTFIENDFDCGVYHITNQGSCSWFEFAQEIIRQSHCDCRIVAVGSDQFPRPARRPACSILINTRLKNNMRHWKEALKHYLEGKE